MVMGSQTTPISCPYSKVSGCSGVKGGAGAQDCVTSMESADNKEWVSDR